MPFSFTNASIKAADTSLAFSNVGLSEKHLYSIVNEMIVDIAPGLKNWLSALPEEERHQFFSVLFKENPTVNFREKPELLLDLSR